MAEVYFLADGHFGHKNILKFRDRYGFKSVEDHNKFIVDRINETVTKRDKLWLLGDWVFNNDALEWIDQIKNGSKHLILGNHDDYTLPLNNHFLNISGDIKYKEFWLSHIPVHDQELRGKLNIHGHMHYDTIDDWRYMSVCCEQTNFRPISLTNIRKIFERRKAAAMRLKKRKLTKLREM